MKLNLGCSETFLPGFVHIDIGDYPHLNYRHDIRTLPMIDDSSVELIYSSHALTYLDMEDVEMALREWYRKLKSGGILRLAVDDFESIIKVYQKYGDISRILGCLYGKWNLPSGDFIYQKSTYDFKSLKKLLEKVGFKNVRRYDWRDTIHKDYDDYSQSYIPHMDKENGILMSLNLECVK